MKKRKMASIAAVLCAATLVLSACGAAKTTTQTTNTQTMTQTANAQTTEMQTNQTSGSMTGNTAAGSMSGTMSGNASDNMMGSTTDNMTGSMTDNMSAGTAAGTSGAAKNADGYTVIKAEEAKKMIDAGGVVIVDVRRADEYAAKHIPDAINVPNESISTEMPKELPDQGAVILIYCRTGIRAADASAKLAKIGYTNVYDMGGIVDWPYETTK